ncbi:gastrula zinc finger protein XlCGF57.1 isoform X2 [Betta splendens]|uniref:Gastrula zinc finger protein XlCGF57.1 isoform X2 n=1 Tax=Betta splendens TaxID=158456 RepID=A0A6P7KZE0_BETSP|nr:gastrula zinc finger protein XlCGF57.1 isoform X2 [Betta splendens]
MKMSSVKQHYRDISPVTLHLVGGAVTSRLYCGEVEGLSEGLVEAFLVELYRCKLCQFTCGLKTSISSHLLLRHHPSTLNYLADADREGAAEIEEEAGLDQLSLTRDSKQSDEDEELLLYNMLDSISPSTCDISTEGGLQVAHACEVSTLFDEEEESSVFRLKGASLDLSSPIDAPATQEELAQSAHLMSLGLCRISASKPPLPPGTGSFPHFQCPPPPDGSPCSKHLKKLKQSRTDSSRRKLSCLLCPLTLTSKRLLDVHIQSHCATGGFSCVCCTWTTNSWEELEPHWRSHSRRRRRKRRRVEQTLGKKTKATLAAVSSQFSCLVCRRTFTNAASRNSHQKTHQLNNYSEKWRGQLIGQAAAKEAEHSNRSMQSVTERGKKRTTRKKTEEEEVEAEKTGFCCLLCPRKFSSKLTLKRHVSVHAGEKPFTCPHCPYSSRLKASLLQHLRTHTGERPYRCPECAYASIDRSSLLRHSRTHSQEKPHRCQHCDYSSIQKKSLDLHCRRHHTGEVFPCQRCEYSSPDRQLLLRHIRRHHAECDLRADL